MYFRVPQGSPPVSMFWYIFFCKCLNPSQFCTESLQAASPLQIANEKQCDVWTAAGVYVCFKDTNYYYYICYIRFWCFISDRIATSFISECRMTNTELTYGIKVVIWMLFFLEFKLRLKAGIKTAEHYSSTTPIGRFRYWYNIYDSCDDIDGMIIALNCFKYAGNNNN